MIVRAYIGGTFDLFHYGHVKLLKAAKEAFGYVVVGLNRDEFVERFKRRPIMTMHERWNALDGCRWVDEVIVNVGDEDSRPAILTAKADFVVHGDDWRGEALMKQMGLTVDWLENHNVKMFYLPYTKTISSSEIIERIKNEPQV